MTTETPLTIRPSTVGSHMLCAARPGQRGHVGYNYLPNEALLFGSATHWCIEQELSGIKWSRKELILAMFDMFEKDQPGPDPIPLSKFTTKAKREAMASEAIEAVKHWHDVVLPSLPASVPVIEERLGAIVGTHDDYVVTVSGTPDIFYPDDGLLIDWKTAGRMWKPEKVEGQIQPTAYRWLTNENGYNIQDFTFWVYDRSASFWAEFKAQPLTKGAVEAFKRQAVVAAVQIEEDTFGYNPAGQGWSSRGWHCSPKYCDAWKICKGKYLINDGKASLPAMTDKERWS